MSAHVDAFVRDNLPLRDQWPALIFTLPELQFPAQYNASSILDRAVANGLGANNAVLCGAVALSYEDLLRDACRIAHVLTHNHFHRAELLHMLARLGLPDLPEGDLLSWEQQTRASIAT